MRLNQKQIEWISKASYDERMAFLMKGPAHVADTFYPDSGEMAYLPMIRGVVAGAATDTSDEALQVAERQLKEIRNQYPDQPPVIDEDALGISTTNYELLELCDEAHINFEKVIHLGAKLGAGVDHDDELDEFIEDVYEPVMRGTLVDKLPFLADIELDEQDDLREVLLASLALGFLVCASTPVPNFRSSDSCTFSWGHTTYRWFYGETFQEAARQAAHWAHQYWDEKRQAQVKAAS